MDGQPKLLSLKEMLEAFLRHRREVVTRRTIYDLRKARERAHILEGLAVALANIDEIIALIKASPTRSRRSGALHGAAWPAGHRAADARARGRHFHAPDGLSAEFGMNGGGYRLSEDAGAGDPRHAAAPPHRARAGQDHRASTKSCWMRIGDLRTSSPGRSASRSDPRRADRRSATHSATSAAPRSIAIIST